jgi:hypothetical protein
MLIAACLPLVFLVAAWSLLPRALMGEHERSHQMTDRTCRLIAGLGNKGVVIKGWRGNSDPYLIIPKGFDWKMQEHVNDNIARLVEMGVDAFPQLIAHRNDDRFCGFRVGEVDTPRRVGSICEDIIEGQIDVFPYEVDRKIVMTWVPHPLWQWDFEKGKESDKEEMDWNAWWKKNKNRSLYRLQIDVAEAAIAILKKSKRDDEGFASWRSRQIKGLEQMIQELKKSKKPKPPRGAPHVSTIPRALVKTVGNEQRYYFYNGK